MIPLNQTDLYCDPSTTKLPLPKSEQEVNNYHAAFWDMLEASGKTEHDQVTVALDLNDVDSDGIWLDSEGEPLAWDNWKDDEPQGDRYAITIVSQPFHISQSDCLQPYQKQWATDTLSTSVVCELDCSKTFNCVSDRNVCNGSMSNVLNKNELLTCLDGVSNDIQFDQVIYTRKAINGKRSGHGLYSFSLNKVTI